MRRWSSRPRRGPPPDTPASVWTVASQQLLRRLKLEKDTRAKRAAERLSSGCQQRGRRQQQRSGAHICAVQYVEEGQVLKFFYDARFVLRALMRKGGPQKAGTWVKPRDLRRNLANFNRRDEEEQIWPRLWRRKKRGEMAEDVRSSALESALVEENEKNRN